MDQPIYASLYPDQPCAQRNTLYMDVTASLQAIDPWFVCFGELTTEDPLGKGSS